MCLTIPGRIKKIDGNFAILEGSFGLRKVNTMALGKVKIGDWLLATTGLAVKKINKDEAQELIKLLKGHNYVNNDKIDKKLLSILENARKRSLNRDEIIFLLNLRRREDVEALFLEADVIRKSYLKDFICIHGIIEFSNYCENNCSYCGLRFENKKLKRYRMSLKEIIGVIDNAVNKIGYKMLVLQSGVDKGWNDTKLIELIKLIKQKYRVFIFVSIGERSLKCYKEMKKAGADGILLRFETSNKELYQRLHFSKTLKGNFDKRLKLISDLKKNGYYISSGSIIGLPGQTIKDLANDVLMMKKMNVGMVSMGPFVPSENTLLGKEKEAEAILSLKMIAICRLLMKEARIPVTSALETIGGEEIRKKGLSCGANSLMFNLTPRKYRKDYKIYNNKFYGRNKKLERAALFQNEDSWRMIEQEFRKKI